MECTSDTAGHYLLILLGSHCRVPEPAWLREGRAFNSSWAASPVIVPILQVTKFPLCSPTERLGDLPNVTQQ